MKKFAFGLAMSACLAFAGEYKGTISDAKCGAAHADASPKAMKCVAGCVKNGVAPVFVTDGKVLKIADASKVNEHLGHKVTITGTIDGDTIKVDSVKMD